MALSQAAVVKLILKYIGGSKVKGSTTTEVDGKPVVIKNASLSELASLIGKYGSTLEQVRNAIFSNPKDQKIAEVASNVASAVEKIQTDPDVPESQKQSVLSAVASFNETLTRYKQHTDILSGITVVDELAEQSQEFLDDVAAFTTAAELAANLANTSLTEAEAAVTTAEQAATNALESENDAATFASSAATSATNAGTSESNAASSAATAASSATDAGDSATAAASSASNASTSADQSGSSATASEASRIAAETAATNSANSASAASTSASAANASETAAGQSASAAQTSATEASTSASNASTSETNSAGSETNAAGSAAAALSSETTAAQSATDAGQSASAAASSASAASASETAAGTSATAASQSATNASTSESAASISATNAATSETNAAGSETNASTSASQAATSATSAGNSASVSQTSATNAGNSATSAATSEQLAAEFALIASANATAIRLTPNGHFDSGRELWFATPALPQNLKLEDASDNTLASTYNSFTNVVVSGAGNTRPIYSKVVTVETARTYQVRAKVYHETTNQYVTIGVLCYDASGNNLGIRKCAANSVNGNVGWQEYEGTIAGEGTLESEFPAGTVQCMVVALLNYTNQPQSMGVDYLYIEDVTESTSSAISANAAQTSSTSAAASAQAASTSASNAATSEFNAGNSETNAAGSETNAATSATNASNSATSASASASSASSSETNAANSETAAGNSASAAATSESNASTSATDAGNSATSATSSALTASSSESNSLLALANAAPRQLVYGAFSRVTSVFDGVSPDEARFNDNTFTSGGSDLYYIQVRTPINYDSSRTYKLVYTIKANSGDPYHGGYMDRFDDNGSHVGGINWNTFGGLVETPDTYQTYEITIPTLASNTAFFRMGLTINRTSSASVNSAFETSIKEMYIVDTTEADQIATDASAAQTASANATASETAASTSASNAATSAVNAANSETAAATSATNASTSETNASASAASASSSETLSAEYSVDSLAASNSIGETPNGRFSQGPALFTAEFNRSLDNGSTAPASDDWVGITDFQGEATAIRSTTNAPSLRTPPVDYDPNRTYLLHLSVFVEAGSFGSLRNRAVFFDSSSDYTDFDQDVTNFAGLTANQWNDFTLEVNAAGVDSDAVSITSSPAFVSPSSDLVVSVRWCYIEDVTDARAIETSVTAAVTAETNAAASANGASTSASNAATSEFNAASSATAASTSETNADASAVSAATSATLSATSAGSSIGALDEILGNGAPSTFVSGEDDFGFQHVGTSVTFPTVAGEGVVAEVNGTNYFRVEHKDGTPLVPGHTYNLNLRIRTSAGGDSDDDAATIYFISRSTEREEAYGGGIAVLGSANVPIPNDQNWVDHTISYTCPDPAPQPYVIGRIFCYTSNIAATRTIQIQLLQIEDTDTLGLVETATNAATAAQTAEVNATANAASAASSATLSATSAAETFVTAKKSKVVINEPDDYRLVDDFDLSVGDAPSTAVTVNDDDFGKAVEVDPNDGTVRLRVPLTIEAGRKYRLTIPVKYLDPLGSGSTRLRIRPRDYDAVTGASLGDANTGWSVTGNYMADGETDLFIRELDGDTYFQTVGNGGVVFLWLFEDPDRAGCKFRFGAITWDDITQETLAGDFATISENAAVSANTSATSANTSATLASGFVGDAQGFANAASASATVAQTAETNATANAASAASSVALTASLATSHLNPNSSFSNWTGTLPENWLGWSGGTRTKVDGGSPNPNAIQIVSPAGGNSGIYQHAISSYDNNEPVIIGGNWYIVEADITLDAGTLRGAGMSVFQYQSDGSTITSSDPRVSFTGEDVNGIQIGDGVVGQRYRFQFLFQADALATRFRTYAMNHYGSWVSDNNATANKGDMSASNTITWHSLGVRPAELEASVTVNQGAIASVANNAAFYETVVAASGSEPARVRLTAGDGGSSVSLVAETVSILNPVDDTIAEVAKFADGKAQLNNALIRGLKVFPTAGSEIAHEVQLKPLLFLAKDGDVVEFQDGDDYGENPDRIVPNVSGLPTLAEGESYDVKATAISGTQFTARVKKITAGGLVDEVSSAGAGGHSDPTWRTNKPTAADAYNDYYQFNFAGSIPKTNEDFFVEDFGDTGYTYYYYATYSGSVALKGKTAGGSWITLGTVSISGNRTYTTNGPGGSSNPATISYSRAATVQSNEDLGTGTDHFGIEPNGSTTVSSFTSVEYATQSATGETAVSGKIPWEVYPPIVE